MASDGHYSVGEIVQMHMYHCLDCLYQDVVQADGAYDCGCDTAMVLEIRQRFLNGEDMNKVWSQHIVEAIKEYAK